MLKVPLSSKGINKIKKFTWDEKLTANQSRDKHNINKWNI